MDGCNFFHMTFVYKVKRWKEGGRWNVLSNYYDENELIRRIQKGDESALAIIISEYHAYVGKIVYSILGSYSHKIDLQGVVNQIFFTLWHKSDKIEP